MEQRRPDWVYQVGAEPDPRYSLANERTFLAWVRTSLAIVAGAVALESVGFPESDRLRLVLVVALLLLGALSSFLAWIRWARIERAMRTGEPLPAFTVGLLMSVGVIAVAVLLAAVVIVG